MQITPDYCRTMARYNAWQNQGLRKIVVDLPKVEYERDRGAFFGSIRGTLNHLLWADMVWMHRFSGSPNPGLSIRESVDLTATATEWATERFRLDARFVQWAEGLRAVDLAGELGWYSGALGQHVSRPRQFLAMHVFNHQTHHRGQVHAMLTAAGVRPADTDLFLMPAD